MQLINADSLILENQPGKGENNFRCARNMLPAEQDNRNSYQEECETTDLFSEILKALPKTPGECSDYWTNKDIILCSSEEKMCALISFLTDLYSIRNINILTGYYDPDEDEKSGEVDECTGFWYVDIE